MTSDRRGFRVNLWIFFAVNGAIALAWVGCTVVGVSLHGFVWPWLAMVLLWGARLAYEARHAKRGIEIQTEDPCGEGPSPRVAPPSGWQAAGRR